MNVFDVLREKLGNELPLFKIRAIEIVNQVEQEYNDSLPKPIPIESADYAHEASYIQGWNECLEKYLKTE